MCIVQSWIHVDQDLQVTVAVILNDLRKPYRVEATSAKVFGSYQRNRNTLTVHLYTHTYSIV